MKVILAEKPSVAKDIAAVLGADASKGGYREGNGYQVTWAYGHLVSLADANEYLPHRTKSVNGNEVPDLSWRVEDLPIIPEKFIYKVTTDPSARKQFNVIKELFRDADEIICATDAGREGEAIFRYIYNLTGSKVPFKRLWISSLTETAIKNGFKELKDGRDFDDLYRSAKARNEADWLVGINGSRALCLSSKQKLSVGRVQTPTLAIICQRFYENRDFKPTPYYAIEVCLNSEKKFKALYPSSFKTKEEAEVILAKIKESVFVEDKTRKEVTEKPPLPYSLTALQEEANRRFKLSAQQTLDTIQGLYEKKILTYPRTDSRYLGTDMISEVGKKITLLSGVGLLKDCAKGVEYLSANGIEKFCFDNNKLTDHHAIIPTFENLDALDGLSKTEKDLFGLISRQLVMALLPVCKKSKLSYKFMFDVQEERLVASGSTILEPGWRMIFEKVEDEDSETNSEEEQDLPDLKQSSHVDVVSKEAKEKMTKKPPLHTEATLLKLMETAGKLVDDEEARNAMKNCGIGTPATRASIIETLLKRDMIAREKNRLIPTEMGLQVYNITKEMAISQPQLTGEWENKLNKMADGEYEFDMFQDQITDETKYLTSVMLEVGNTVTRVHGAVSNLTEMKCPICGAPLKENSKAIGCSQFKKEGDGCKFVIWKEVSEKKLSEKELSDLIANLATEKPVSGLKSKAGNKFSARIVFNRETNRMEFLFENKELGKCPKCGGKVLDMGTFCACEGKCGFSLVRTFSGHKFTEKEMGELLVMKQLKGLKFKSAKTGADFSADISLGEDWKLNLEFKKKK